ncbi:UDP-N-acetylmuramate dehydrogenase [Amycolatopsis jiangsuensis]|uniref:UDP-N-acetylmuramate dehydrogenase n=1 Tax=Amycolatopsis jiangsuensis TaxID=1181879 RepID=UPI001FE829F2
MADGTAAPRLADCTTLRLGGPARRFVHAATSEDLVAAVRDADDAGEPVLLLGGGSNLVVADDGFAGTLVRIASSGWTRDGDGDGDADGDSDGDVVEVAAGQEWDAFVAELADAGLGGLECLSGIPGSVGATPIQNVGAYGCEVAESIVSVRLYDRAAREIRTVPAGELGFGYRTSVLKGTDRGVVLSVRFRIDPSGESAPVRYAELARTLGVEIGAKVPTARAREAVLGLRRGKGMVLDPADHDTWSAGSFFTNPIVPADESAATVARITAAAGEPPQYPAEGGVKLSAAWLIDRAGFGKGHPGPGGRVSLSTKHTLALTNRGGASTADLLALARQVRDGVEARFGVRLHPEPLLIGCAL